MLNKELLSGLIPEDCLERAKIYGKLYEQAMHKSSTTRDFSHVDTFFKRYSRVINDDLKLDLPSYFWMSESEDNEDSRLAIQIRYARIFVRHIFLENSKSIQIHNDWLSNVAAIEGIDIQNGVTDESILLSYKDASLRAEQMFRAEQQKKVIAYNEVSPKIESLFGMFLYDLRRNPLSLPLVDEEYISLLQRIELKKRTNVPFIDDVHRISLSHMGLVVSYAKRFADVMDYGQEAYDLQIMDLIQEGYIHLQYVFSHKCDWRYNIAQSSMFGKSLYHVILRSHIKHVRNHAFDLSVKQHNRLRVYKKSFEGLMDTLQRNPTRAELTKALRAAGLTSDQVADLYYVVLPTQNVHYTARQVNEEQEFVVDTLGASGDSVEDEVMYSLLLQEVDSFTGRSLVNRRTAEEVSKEMLARRLGAWDGELHTLDRIGQEFGLSRERVRQRTNPLLTELRSQLADYRGK